MLHSQKKFKLRRSMSCLALFCYAAIFLLYDSSPSAVYHTANDRHTLTTYYHLLETMTDDSSVNVIPTLQNFLENHPEFEYAYQKLLQDYLMHDNLCEAKEYFQNLSENPKNRRNAYWMLAKIFSHQDDANAAFETFVQALRHKKPSFVLLNDFIHFDIQHASKFGGNRLLKQNEFRHYPPEISSPIFSYWNSSYANTIEMLSKLPDEWRHNNLILQIFGSSFYRIGKHAEADSIWQIGLQHSRAQGDMHSEAEFLRRLGLAARFTNYDKALSYFDSARTLATRIDDRSLLLIIALNFAGSYLNKGEYEKAIVEYKNAIKLASRTDAKLSLSKAYLGLGEALFNLNRYSDALNFYEKSERIATIQNNYQLLTKSKRKKGELYLYLYQHDIAAKIFEEGYDLAEKHKLSKEKHRIAVSLADIKVAKGKYEEARHIYNDFINVTNNLLVKTYYLAKTAETYKHEKRYKMAMAKYVQAYESAKLAGDENYVGWLLLYMAQLKVITGEIDEAFQKYNLSYRIATTVKDSSMLTEVHLGFGDGYKNLGDLKKAISHYTQAAQIIEKTRENIKVDQLRIGYFSDTQKVYRKLAQCFLERYESKGNSADLDSIFYALEMSRARALQDLKLGSKSLTNTPGYDKYLKACKELSLLQRHLREGASKFATDSLEPLLAQIEAAQYSVIAQRMRLASATTDESTLSPSLPSLGAVQKQLKQNELGLLLYHIDEEGSFVMAVQGDDIKIKRLSVTPNLLEASIDSFITPFHNVNEDLVSQVPFKATIANRLYEFLVKPVEEFNLPKRLLIVRDITLMKLPFEMLLTETPYKTEYIPKDEPDYADYFLINRYSIVYTPSTSLLQTSPIAGSPNQDVLLFANPFAASQKPDKVDQQFTLRTGMRFDPLLYSEIEANRIKEIYSDTRIYKREKATSLSFLEEASKYQYLHLATHAFVNTTFDAFSGLVLAASADSTDDGILMGYEIADLNLSSDLVTLSACETGRGKIIDGEGVLGLPRLFLGAGAKSVLMTHWKVDDKFASEMMPAFYNYYLNKGLSKGDALANAKRDILGRSKKVNDVYYQHPFYWASFTLYGDPGQERKSTFWYKASVMAAILILVIVIIVRKRANLKILP